MKIIATADLHGYFPTIEPCDLLIIAGDVCPIKSDDFSLREHQKDAQVEWILSTFKDWCAEQPAEDIVWIAGNHDFGAEVDRFDLEVGLEFPGNCHYLQSESITIQGKHIYGMPWTPNLSTWAFYARDDIWHWLGDDIPGDTDILVLHSPPTGVMLDGGHPNWASPYILTQITSRVRPDLCLCGHIHEGYGETVVKDIKFANVAYCDEFYDPIQQPKVFEL